ncbi:MAG TPA: VOC family protein [Polyangia bacterium]|nr:VOC family protein [Polyangia bacterium]
MPNVDYVLLAVKEPQRSAQLYSKLLGRDPVESSPGFVLYAPPAGPKVGLWAAHEVRPTPRPAGGVELSFSLPDEASVRRTFADWRALGLEVVQEPTRMDFGFTCVLADPDGHRLRPFALADDPR